MNVQHCEYLCGATSLPHSRLYVGISRINLATATDTQLQHLAETCDAATFGRDQKDTFDESYRRAGKLDAAHFAPKFDPERCGLVESVSGFLLEGHADSSVRVELYKLNVYGIYICLFHDRSRY